MKKKRKKIVKEYVYVSRDSSETVVEIYPATVGLRKFHRLSASGKFRGHVIWGAAWHKEFAVRILDKMFMIFSDRLTKYECRKRFGFYPRKGTAWFVNGKKRTKVDINFS